MRLQWELQIPPRRRGRGGHHDHVSMHRRENDHRCRVNGRGLPCFNGGLASGSPSKPNQSSSRKNGKIEVSNKATQSNG